jgi:hypothetical protein
MPSTSALGFGRSMISLLVISGEVRFVVVMKFDRRPLGIEITYNSVQWTCGDMILNDSQINVPFDARSARRNR